MRNAFCEGLERDENKMLELRARAQVNEHIYTMLAQSGLSVRIDGDIGMEFLRVDAITR